MHPFRDLESLQQELLSAAIQDVCVLLAHVTAASSPKGLQRSYHGSARRLIRTLVRRGFFEG